MKFGCDRRRGRSKADSGLANSDVFRDSQGHSAHIFCLQNTHAEKSQVSELDDLGEGWKVATLVGLSRRVNPDDGGVTKWWMLACRGDTTAGWTTAAKPESGTGTMRPRYTHTHTDQGSQHMFQVGRADGVTSAIP